MKDLAGGVPVLVDGIVVAFLGRKVRLRWNVCTLKFFGYMQRGGLSFIAKFASYSMACHP